MTRRLPQCAALTEITRGARNGSSRPSTVPLQCHATDRSRLGADSQVWPSDDGGRQNLTLTGVGGEAPRLAESRHRPDGPCSVYIRLGCAANSSVSINSLPAG